jgi:hypothetical protein
MRIPARRKTGALALRPDPRPLSWPGPQIRAAAEIRRTHDGFPLQAVPPVALGEPGRPRDWDRPDPSCRTPAPDYGLPDAAKRAEAKIQRFQSAVNQDIGQKLEMDESGLNGWLIASLALKKQKSGAPAARESLIARAKKAGGIQGPGESAPDQKQSLVRDVKTALREDSLRLYAAIDFHGVDVSLELEGKLLVRDGYLRLEPTGGKLDSLPLMSGALQSVAGRLFDSAENREKFRLPPQIREMRIEHGHLVIASP